MDYLSDQIISFEKCVSNELGPDIVNQVKNHYTTSFGQFKPVIDYMFTNLHSSKLVALNLKIDSNIQSNKNIEKDANPLKKKNLDLKKKLNELKSILNNEETEINSLIQNTRNVQKRLNKSKNELLNKQSSYLMQESTVKKALEISNNLNESTRQLFFLTNSKQQSDMNDYNECNNQNLNLENLFDIAKSQSVEDFREVSNVTNSFNSDLELILYRIDSSNQLLDTNLAQTHVNTFDKVNDLHMELINRDCQKRGFIKEIESYSKQSSSIKAKISDFLKKNYPKDSMLYGQYLLSYLKYKSSESNLNELKSCLKTFENEIDQLNNTPDLIAEKQNQLNALDKNIHLKQLKLNELFKEINEKLVNLLPTNNHQMKSNTECLLELVFSFNSNFYHRNSKLDVTFNSINYNNNNPILAALNQQSGLQTQIEVYNYKDKNIVDSSLFQENLFSFNELKSQRALFNKFISLYLEIKNKLVDLEKLNRISSKIVNAKQLMNDLKNSLEKCKFIEKNELSGFAELLKQKLDNLNRFDQELDQLDKLIDIWIKQPGAYECTLEKEVKGKRLDYYMDRIDEAIALMNKSCNNV